jgi:hypothetical protein
MVRFEESIVINRRPSDVFAFVSDLENDPPWSSATEIHRTSHGPIGIGTTFHQTDRFLGRHVDLHFEVVEYSAGRLITMRSDSGLLALEGTRMVDPLGTDASLVTIVGGGHARGFLGLFESPLAALGAHRLRKQLVKLKQLLEAPGHLHA